MQSNKNEDLLHKIKPKKPKKLKIILFVLLSLSFCFFVFYLERKQTKNQTGYLPLIKSDKNNFKVKPNNPGGMVFANADKTIYDNFSQKPIKEIKETLLPEPEKEVDRNKYLSDLEANKDYNKKLNNYNELKPHRDDRNIKDIKELQQDDHQKSLLKPLEQKNSKDKGYMLQLASFKSYKIALSGVEEIKKKHKKLIHSYKIYIEKKDIEYNKQFYRLQLGPIVNESLARLLCKKLKNEGQDCMIIKP